MLNQNLKMTLKKWCLMIKLVLVGGPTLQNMEFESVINHYIITFI